MKNERLGRKVFYGAMISEGVVAMIWAAAAIKFADSLPGDGTAYEKLWAGGSMSPSVVVNAICNSWLGTVGAVLAILGVVAAPITSGDTAFRSARLISADFFHLKQNKIYKRLLLSVPLFVVALVLMFVDFSVLWRYFGWVNQTMSVFTLWAVTVWLARKGRCYWISLVPAVWMTLVSVSYILVAPEGFQLRPLIADVAAVVVAALLLGLFFWWKMTKASFLKDEKD